jgi:ATP-binding cassette subfamily F protein 3
MTAIFWMLSLHIAEMEDGRIVTFTSNYTEYILDKEERLVRQEELYKTQQHEIGRLEAAIKRYALWGKIYDNEDFARKAKSMQKRLDKMDKVEKPILERRKMDLALNGWRGSNQVLEMEGVSKMFLLTPLRLRLRLCSARIAEGFWIVSASSSGMGNAWG